MNKKKTILIAIIIGASGFLFQLMLQSVMRPYAINGFYFQEWSSETLMQTVSIIDLNDAPLETLFNIHIQPPGLDLIRAMLLHIWPTSADINTVLLHVDHRLYRLWALLYGILGSTVFLWVSKLTNIKISIITTILFLLHPASILYATLLDGTLLTSFLVFLFYYLLWKIKNRHSVSLTLVILTILALFFTRSIFQLPFALIVAASLFLLGMPKRKTLVILLITVSISVLYMAKQYYQFGIFSTSSFTGLNLNRSIGYNFRKDYRNYLKLTNYPDEQEDELPKTLTRKQKLNGSSNLNNIRYLELNQKLIEQYKQYILTTPPLQLIKSYSQSVEIYFGPSSTYAANIIVDRLPWSFLYDQVFSSPIIFLLIGLFGTSWFFQVIKRKDYISSIGILLPGLFIFLITTLFEKGENHRFKFFLEPVLFAFFSSQLYSISSRVYQKVLAQLRVNRL